MKIIVDNKKCKIETDNPELLTTLIDLFAVPEPGAFYKKSFSNYRWGGKKFFVSKAGYFKTGLLYRVYSELLKVCQPEIEKKFAPPLLHDKKAFRLVKKYSPYDYQKSLVIKALQLKRCIVKSPTGSGKTLMMALLLHNLNIEKSLFLFSKKQLVTQTYEFFKSCGIEDIGMNHGEGFIPGRHMLSTIQSLGKIADDVVDAELLVVDEAHEFAGTKRARILCELDAFYRIGFTATPPSDIYSLYNIEGALGPVISEVTTQELIDQDKLSKPEIYILNIPSPTDQGHKRASYIENYREYIIENKFRNDRIKSIVDNARKKNKEPKIVIIVKNLEHLEILRELIPNTMTIEGKNSLEDRYKTIDEFLSSSENNVILCTKVLESGINIEEITHLVNARGLKKDIPTLQALGRLLRKSDTKDIVYYYDFMDSARYLSDHSKSRKKYYKKEGYEINEI